MCVLAKLFCFLFDEGGARVVYLAVLPDHICKSGDVMPPSRRLRNKTQPDTVLSVFTCQPMRDHEGCEVLGSLRARAGARAICNHRLRMLDHAYEGQLHRSAGSRDAVAPR